MLLVHGNDWFVIPFRQPVGSLCWIDSLVVHDVFGGATLVEQARRDGTVINVAPEYEDCSRLAAEQSVPLKEVMLAAQLAYAQRK